MANTLQLLFLSLPHGLCVCVSLGDHQTLLLILSQSCCWSCCYFCMWPQLQMLVLSFFIGYVSIRFCLLFFPFLSLSLSRNLKQSRAVYTPITQSIRLQAYLAVFSLGIFHIHTYSLHFICVYLDKRNTIR